MPDDQPADSIDFAKGTLWGYAGQFAFYGFSYVFTVFLAFSFPKEAVGIYYLAYTVITLIGLVADLGFSGALGRFVPFFDGKGQRSDIPRLLLMSYLIVLMSGILLTGVLIWQAGALAEFYHTPSLALALLALSPLLILNNLTNIGIAFLRGRGDIKSVSFVQNFQNILKLAFVFLISYFFLGGSLLAICLALVFSVFISLILSIERVFSKLGSLPQLARPFFSKDLLVSVLPYCATSILMGSIGIVFSASTQLLIGFLVPPAMITGSLASYSLALTIGSVLMLFPSSILGIFLPVVSKMFAKGDTAGLVGAAHTSQRWCIISITPFALVLCIFSAETLRMMYGSGYMDGSILLSLYVLSLVFTSLSQVMVIPLSAMLKLKSQLSVTIVSGLIAILLNIFFIQRFGIAGAGIAAIISALITLALFWDRSKKLVRIGFSEDLGPVIVSALFTTLVLVIARIFATPVFQYLSQISDGGSAFSFILRLLSILALGAISSLSLSAFFLSLVLLKGIRKDDLRIFSSVVSKVPLPESVVRWGRSVLESGMPA